MDPLRDRTAPLPPFRLGTFRGFHTQGSHAVHGPLDGTVAQANTELGNWPTDVFADAELESPISPTALGNIDNSGAADVLFSTELDGKCTILAFDSDAEYSEGLDIPIVLPDDVSSYGGFAIADIDRDGTVELVFGTSDGKLHCWELGSCTTGYSPWTQFQHDDGRTGVLE